jgi:SAM-dependent methyltransferase
MSSGWEESTDSWIKIVGERGDWGREHVLDPVMLRLVDKGRHEAVLDVGCGEGRFCRMLKSRKVSVIGIDPTARLIGRARSLDPGGMYHVARAEALPFSNSSFDLVVSYVTMVDIEDFRAALREMSRVLRPGGRMLIANINGFVTSCSSGWVLNADGKHLHYPVDRYLEEFGEWKEWSGMRIRNWHRPLGAYMRELIDLGYILSYFDEPPPVSGDADRQALYRRAPWFVVMEWTRG